MSALGTELKLNVHLKPLDGFHMSDYDFECEFFVFTNRSVVIKKSQLKRLDDDNYYAIIGKDDAMRIGRGAVKCMVTAYIPDNDFEDGVRTERRLFVCQETNVT